jgi:hypothetical protein
MKRAEPGWSVLVLAGIAALIGSLLPFYTFGSGVELTVWNRSLFPTATLIPVLVFAIGLEGLFVLLMGYEPRSPFLSFTWSQARLAGTAFAIVLSLGYLVQGRAGGDLGSGYLIMSLSTLASFAGAVMTRRAELARGREEITPAEHPWRAAFLRWRTELTEKANAYAAGGKEGAQASPGTEATHAAKGTEEPDSTSDDETPAPIPLPRLSAVQSEPEPEDEPVADGDEPAADADEPAAAEETAADGEAAADGEPAAEATADGEAATDGEPAAEATAESELAAEPPRESEAAAEAEVEAAAEVDDTERERPAAPG